MAFVLSWALAETASNIFLIVVAWGELRRRGIVRVWQADARAFVRLNSGLLSFLWTTNIHSSIKLAVKEIDVLVLGTMLDASAAGLFRVVKQIAGVLGRLVGPLQQAVYPQLAEVVHRRDMVGFHALCYRPMRLMAMLYALVLVAFVSVGSAVIEMLLGHQFLPAYQPAVIYLLGGFVAASTFTLHPAALALGRPRAALAILSIVSALYLLALYILVPFWGIAGASAAYLLFYAVWAILMFVGLRSWASDIAHGKT